MKSAFNNILKENYLLSFLLLVCPALAITTTFEKAYLMGIIIIITFMLFSVLSLFTNKIENKTFKLVLNSLILGLIITPIELYITKYIPSLENTFIIFLPVIAINFIVIDKITIEDKKNSKNLINRFLLAICFIVVISVIALIREIIGSNTITVMNNISSITGYKAVYANIIPSSDIYPMSIIMTNTGAFFILAFIAALFKKIRGGKKNESN